MTEHDYFEAWWKKQELGDKANYENNRGLMMAAWNGWLARSSFSPEEKPLTPYILSLIESMHICVMDTDASGRPDGSLFDTWTELRALLTAASSPQKTSLKGTEHCEAMQAFFDDNRCKWPECKCSHDR